MRAQRPAAPRGGGRRRDIPASSLDRAVLPKSPDDICWKGLRLAVRLACWAAFLRMAELNRSSKSCIAAPNLGAQFSGMGVPVAIHAPARVIASMLALCEVLPQNAIETYEHFG